MNRRITSCAPLTPHVSITNRQNDDQAATCRRSFETEPLE